MTTRPSETVSFLRSRKHTRLFSHILYVILSLVFFAAALAKSLSFRELQATLVASKLVPVLMISQVATLLLVFEYLISVLLLLPATRRPALHSAAVLVCIFISYSVWRWLQDIHVPCSCFGLLFKLAPSNMILVDLLLMSAIVYLLTEGSNRKEHTPEGKLIH
jgi:hypothetical protein